MKLLLLYSFGEKIFRWSTLSSISVSREPCHLETSEQIFKKRASFYFLLLLQNPPVRSGDGVKVGLLPVVNISIRLPDLPKHLNAQRKSILGKYFSDNRTFDCNKTLLNLNKLSIVSE